MLRRKGGIKSLLIWCLVCAADAAQTKHYKNIFYNI